MDGRRVKVPPNLEPFSRLEHGHPGGRTSLERLRSRDHLVCQRRALTVRQLGLLAAAVLPLLCLLSPRLPLSLPLLPAPNDAALVERLQAKDPPPVYCHAEI